MPTPGGTSTQLGGTVPGDSGRTTFSSRGTRLGLRFSAPDVGGVRVRGNFEMDFVGNQPGTPTSITLGQWHQVEWWAKQSGGLRWWVDGVLNGNYSFSYSGPFTMFQFSPTFGGNVGATKTETDYYWFDHVHLSRP